MQNIIKSTSLFALVMLLFSSCGGEEEKKKEVLRPVVYQEAGLQGNSVERSFSGTAETEKVVNLSFRNNGIITQFDMNLGKRVKKGQLLARLDNVQARLSYEQSLSSLSSSESQMKTAKLNYDRIRSLYEKGSASLSDFENAKNSYQNAQSGFESSERSVDIQKEQINYGFIYAPESGIIASVSSEIDENVSPGQVVAVLNAGGEMTIKLGIPESVINSVRECSNVSVSFSALNGQIFEGQVTEISPAVDRNTATYPVKVALLAPTEEIRAGMAANVTFDFGNGAPDALIIPAKSVGEDSKGRFVFVVNEQDNNIAIIKKQHITLGGFSSKGFEVISGLSVGDKIATAGLQTLLDGQQVSLQK